MEYQNIRMEREAIEEKLRAKGYRITKQRKLLLDIILEQDCTSCKEIIYRASKKDKKIGAATVYRMINALEGINAVSRRLTYLKEDVEDAPKNVVCTVRLDDDTVYRLNRKNWNHVIEAGLDACGYLKNGKVTTIKMERAE